MWKRCGYATAVSLEGVVFILPLARVSGHLMVMRWFFLSCLVLGLSPSLFLRAACQSFFILSQFTFFGLFMSLEPQFYRYGIPV